MVILITMIINNNHLKFQNRKFSLMKKNKINWGIEETILNITALNKILQNNRINSRLLKIYLREKPSDLWHKHLQYRSLSIRIFAEAWFMKIYLICAMESCLRQAKISSTKCLVHKHTALNSQSKIRIIQFKFYIKQWSKTKDQHAKTWWKQCQILYQAQQLMQHRQIMGAEWKLISYNLKQY